MLMIFENAQKLRSDVLKTLGIGLAGTSAYHVFTIVMNIDVTGFSWILLIKSIVSIVLIFLGIWLCDSSYRIMFDLDVQLNREKKNV